VKAMDKKAKDLPI